MIGLEIAFHVQASKRPELLQTLEDLAKERDRPGACQSGTFEEVPGSGHFLWRRWWGTREELDRHLDSVEFRTLLGAIRVLGSLDGAYIVDGTRTTAHLGAAGPEPAP